MRYIGIVRYYYYYYPTYLPLGSGSFILLQMRLAASAASMELQLMEEAMEKCCRIIMMWSLTSRSFSKRARDYKTWTQLQSHLLQLNSFAKKLSNHLSLLTPITMMKYKNSMLMLIELIQFRFHLGILQFQIQNLNPNPNPNPIPISIPKSNSNLNF